MNLLFAICRIEENERMDRERREQAKQQQKQQLQQMQRLSQMQSDNDAPQQPLFGVPKKVSSLASTLRGDNLELHQGCETKCDASRERNESLFSMMRF